ncbi:hypothetical protein MRB53_036507 [Persea americana]|nr:hypothetical protein MRB53_036687 [Persea americana]KAJ8614641.1 hypothetical protein MRB53_036507 [Persea americana]
MAATAGTSHSMCFPGEEVTLVLRKPPSRVSPWSTGQGEKVSSKRISCGWAHKSSFPTRNFLWTSVARLGGQRALGCGGAIIAQLPNLMRHRVRTAGNRSMGGRLILLPPQGWLIVRSRSKGTPLVLEGT